MLTNDVFAQCAFKENVLELGNSAPSTRRAIIVVMNEI